MRRAIDTNNISYTNDSSEDYFEMAFRLAKECRAKNGWKASGKKSFLCRLGRHNWDSIGMPGGSPNDDYIRYCRRDGCNTVVYIEDSLMSGGYGSM